MSYKHLTQDQRSQIQVLKSMGHNQTNIAKAIGVDASTIGRELRRNIGGNGYHFQQAQRLAMARRLEASSKPRKMTDKVVSFIEEKLTLEQWSPEQIFGVLAANDNSISHTRIYQHVWKDRCNGGELYKHLRHKGKKYNYKGGKKSGRGCIPNRVDISARPKVVELKNRLGDWEGDTIVGKDHKGAIVSMVDRKSKFTLLALVAKATAQNVNSAIAASFDRYDNLPIKTTTFDNGKEFSSHQELTKTLGIKCYFATPYHSWERGLNEHTNGLVRQYLPKKTDFLSINDDAILEIEDKLNNRPRKVLGYRTPLEVMQGRFRAQKIALQG